MRCRGVEPSPGSCAYFTEYEKNLCWLLKWSDAVSQVCCDTSVLNICVGSNHTNTAFGESLLLRKIKWKLCPAAVSGHSGHQCPPSRLLGPRATPQASLQSKQHSGDCPHSSLPEFPYWDREFKNKCIHFFICFGLRYYKQKNYSKFKCIWAVHSTAYEGKPILKQKNIWCSHFPCGFFFLAIARMIHPVTHCGSVNCHIVREVPSP